MTCPASFTQNAFRGRNDDGNETLATWKETQNTNWTQAVDTNFRVRFQIQEGAGCAGANKVWLLQYRLTPSGGSPGAWTDGSATSSVVRASASPNVADGAATTDQLTGGTGTFQGGTSPTGGFDEVNCNAGGASMDIAASGNAEPEYCVQILSAAVGNADTVELRVTDAGTAIASYTQPPSITVSESTTVSSPGYSAGTATAIASAASTSSQVVAAAGSSAPVAAGASLIEAAGSSAGTASADAVGFSTIFASGDGLAAGSSTAAATGAATTATVVNSAGVATADAVGTTAAGGIVREGAGAAAGTSTAIAVGTSLIEHYTWANVWKTKEEQFDEQDEEEEIAAILTAIMPFIVEHRNGV